MLTQCSFILFAFGSNVTPHQQDTEQLPSTKTETQKGEAQRMYL